MKANTQGAKAERSAGSKLDSPIGVPVEIESAQAVSASEVCLSVDAVKAHLRGLFEQFGLPDLPQNQKRATLAATALLNGVLAPHEF